MALFSFLGGSLEAGFLILMTRTALNIADGQDSFSLPIVGEVPIGLAVVAGLLLLLLRLALSLGTVRVSVSLIVNASNEFRSLLAGAFLGSSWATQQSEPAGRLQQLVTEFAERAGDVVMAFTTTVSTSLNLAAILIVAVIVDPTATVVVVAALLVFGTVLRPLRRRILLRSRAAAASQMEFAASIAELGSLGQEMQAFGVRDQFVARVDGLVGRWSRLRVRAQEMQNAVLPIYTTLAYGAVVVGLGLAVVVKPHDLAGVGAVMLLMLRSLTYGQQLQTAASTLSASMPFLDRLDETLERYRSDPAPSGSVPPGETGGLRARNVTFSYTAGNEVLHGIDFAIEPGEIVGVIGPSGAGKSTLIELLLGLREPEAGTIEFDGTDLRTVDRSAWSRRTGFVAQDAQLLTGTVAENITFFRSGFSIDAIRSAAEQANIAADIDALPDGYETHLGERGVRLSGGQRQRLSIARALVGAPDLLILDEPTSALDVRSEGLIRDTIASLRGRVTVVVIAHRMSTLDVCDRIMVIEDGALMAFDRPDVLVQRSDFYQEALRLSGIL